MRRHFIVVSGRLQSEDRETSKTNKRRTTRSGADRYTLFVRSILRKLCTARWTSEERRGQDGSKDRIGTSAKMMHVSLDASTCKDEAKWTDLPCDSQMFHSVKRSDSKWEDTLLSASRNVLSAVDEVRLRKEDGALLDIVWIVPTKTFEWSDRMMPLLSAFSAIGHMRSFLHILVETGRDRLASERWTEDWGCRFERCRVLSGSDSFFDVDMVWRGSMEISHSMSSALLPLSTEISELAECQDSNRRVKRRRREGKMETTRSRKKRVYVAPLVQLSIDPSKRDCDANDDGRLRELWPFKCVRIVGSLARTEVAVAFATLALSPARSFRLSILAGGNGTLARMLTRWCRAPMKCEGKEMPRDDTSAAAFVLEISKGMNDDRMNPRLLLLLHMGKTGMCVRAIVGGDLRFCGLHNLWNLTMSLPDGKFLRSNDMNEDINRIDRAFGILPMVDVDEVMRNDITDVSTGGDDDAKYDEDLSSMSLEQLKYLAERRGVVDPVGHKGRKRTWIDALSSVNRSKEDLTPLDRLRNVASRCSVDALTSVDAYVRDKFSDTEPSSFDDVAIEEDLAYLRRETDRRLAKRSALPQSKAAKMLLATAAKLGESVTDRKRNRLSTTTAVSLSCATRLSKTRTLSSGGAFQIESKEGAVPINTRSDESRRPRHHDHLSMLLRPRTLANASSVMMTACSKKRQSQHEASALRPKPLPRDLSDSAREAATMIDLVESRKSRKRGSSDATSVSSSSSLTSPSIRTPSKCSWRELASEVRTHASSSHDFRQWRNRMGIEYRFDDVVAAGQLATVAFSARSASTDFGQQWSARCAAWDASGEYTGTSFAPRRRREGGSHLFAAPPTPIFSPGTKKQLRRQQRRRKDIGDEIASQASRLRRRNILEPTSVKSATANGIDHAKPQETLSTSLKLSRNSKDIGLASRTEMMRRRLGISLKSINNEHARQLDTSRSIGGSDVVRGGNDTRSGLSIYSAAKARQSTASDKDRDRAVVVRSQNIQRLKDSVTRSLERLLPRHVKNDKSYFNKIYRIAYAIAEAFLKEEPGGLSSSLLSEERVRSATRHCQYAVKTIVPLHERILSDESEEEDDDDDADTVGGQSVGSSSVGGGTVSSEGNVLETHASEPLFSFRPPPQLVRRTSLSGLRSNAASGAPRVRDARSALTRLLRSEDETLPRGFRGKGLALGNIGALTERPTETRHTRKRRLTERRAMQLQPDARFAGGATSTTNDARTPLSSQCFVPLN